MHFRRLLPQDIHQLNRVNLDRFTDNFSLNFYHTYLSSWPELCLAAVGGDGEIIGYTIAKTGGEGAEWHAHLSAISIATEYRGMHVAEQLMHELERAAKKSKCAFVDLFVHIDNKAAVSMYERLGYVKHKQLPEYYADGGDGLELRLEL